VNENTNSTTETTQRLIGIRPRVKWSAEQEARPTQVAIVGVGLPSEIKLYDLASEQDELDFVRGKWPINGKYRDAAEGEDLTVFLPHHVIRDDPKAARKENREHKPIQVPVGYEGLKPGDLVLLSLGGLGDRISYAISRFGETKGFTVKRVPPFRLKDVRGDDSDRDAQVLIDLYRNNPGFFRNLAKRDRALIKLRENTRLRRYTQEDRKACHMRIRASFLGDIFCSEEGGFPEGAIEQTFDLALASDPVAMAIEAREKKLNRAVEESLEEIPIYTEVMTHVVGLGPQISAPIISAVQDIGLFDTVGKFKAFCGLHLLSDGSFPRKRLKQRCNWNPAARQAFFNLADMFNKFPKGFWGQRLRVNKDMYRAKHPYPVLRWVGTKKIILPAVYTLDSVTGNWTLVFKDEVLTIPAADFVSRDGDMIVYRTTGKTELTPGTFEYNKKTKQYTIGTVICRGAQDYTKMHIHKMACWRTVSEFAEWLYWKWRTMEGYGARLPRAFPPEDADAIAMAKTLEGTQTSEPSAEADTELVEVAA